VLGLSGGIDSAVTACLAVAALGKDNVRGVSLPSQFSSQHSLDDARVLAKTDWQAIDRAFRYNDNPLFGIKPKDEAERLYQRILSLAPAPIGRAGGEARNL
jgi:hypothetical protein